MHEFLTLHYFAIDSAAGWDELLLKRLPGATLLKANARRLIALDMFEKSHIAPSHRRLPHPSWTTSFCLLLDLLLGAGKTRYLNTRPHARARREVFVRGFSAGSYSGICLLHLLWQLPFVDARGKLGGIACPPELLSTKVRGCTCFTTRETSSVAGSQPSTISKVFIVCVPSLPMNGRISMITLAKVSVIMDTGLICRCRQESFSCGDFYKNYPLQQPPSFEMSPHSD